MDTHRAKELLQSTNVDELRAVVAEYMLHYCNNGSNSNSNGSDSDAQQQQQQVQQLYKLLLLLGNRIVQLQQQQEQGQEEEDTATTAAQRQFVMSDTHVRMAQIWWCMMGGVGGGAAATSIQHVDRCIGQLQRALQCDPANASACALLGDALAVRHQHGCGSTSTDEEEAIVRHYERAIEIYQQQQQHDEQQQQHRTARTVAPAAVGDRMAAVAEVYSKLALHYERRGEFGQAKAVLCKALQQQQQDGTPAAVFGGNEQGEEQQALMRARALLASHLGTLQEKLGEYRDAAATLSTAVQLYEELLVYDDGDSADDQQPHSRHTYGNNHPKLQELRYLLEMAKIMII
jgi:tetratricopeptide (TPR) repeat protein